jgi:uncharacterized protein YyaL (SSP411 family)
VLLPSAHDAATWFVETARAAVASGERIDARGVQLLMALTPGDPIVSAAIETVADEPLTLAGYAREAIDRLHQAVAARDEAAARAIVTELELEVLRVYRPSHGLDGFENDVAVALAMLAAYDVGGDEAHVMMAEELMLGAIRRGWDDRLRYGMAANCDAAMALAALAACTDKPEYRERALDVMRDYAATYRDHGVRAAAYVSALQVIITA